LSQKWDEQPRWKRWAWTVFFVAIFGPFALVLGLAFIGIDSPELLGRIPAFGVWFMGALTASALFLIVDQLMRPIRGERVEWGCLVLWILMAAWFGWVLVRPFLK
jgi:hypothetical protein